MHSAVEKSIELATLPLGEDPEMIGDFILESREHLSVVETQIMALEKQPAEAEALNAVFRGFHTIKGLADFLNFDDIRDVAHETETLLDLARNQRLRITPAVVDVVLASSDFLTSSLRQLETLLAVDRPEKHDVLQRIHAAALDKPDTGSPSGETAPSEQAAGAAPESSETRTVKVDAGKLAYLVELVGEMAIVQSMVRDHPELASLRSPALLLGLSQLARISGELQKTAISMRMVPVGGLFQKMSRLVRDLARKTGKQAGIEAIGAETELERNVVEELAGPLMHMVRNAVDHGLESPEQRRAAGKHPTGRIRLRASHQPGYISIEVADNGRGLVREKILAKARSTGLVGDGSNLPDSEVFGFIFHPGFSTAAQVTGVSGRGVGMDVVKKQIEKLRGRIDIESKPGQGTTFFLRLPSPAST